LKSIVIPSSVVVFGTESFRLCKSLDSVSFESGSRLERIEEMALCGSGLSSIVIPSSVVVLGTESFRECESLEYVIFESGSRLERIEEMAFCGSGLKSIEIPPGVTFIDHSALAGISLSSISVSGDNGNFRLRDGFLEAFDCSTIYRYFGACHSVVIPSSVVVLGRASFCECKFLESVIFERGSRLERIEDSAFSGSGLTSIVIPAGVTFIDGSAFVGLSLSSIWISPDNGRFRVRDEFLEDFDGSVIYRYFGACHSVVIPSSVVVLGKASFCECKFLESVVFESGSRLERIEEFAFEWTGLRSIVIPSSVIVLAECSFFLCKWLESVVFETGSRLERIEDWAFHKSGLKSIVIPSSAVVCSAWGFDVCVSQVRADELIMLRSPEVD
jgi:hypothetical protein